MTADRIAARSVPALALIGAFAPGDARETLIQCRSVEFVSPHPPLPNPLPLKGARGLVCERIVAEFRLGDPLSRARAFVLAARPPACADVPMAGWMFAELNARVCGDLLLVEGVAVRDDDPAGGRVQRNAPAEGGPDDDPAGGRVQRNAPAEGGRDD